MALPAAGPRVVLCLDGAVTLVADRADAEAGTRLVRGESVFVPHRTGAVVMRGEGEIVVAFVP